MSDNQDNVRTLLKKAEDFLKKKKVPSARLDAELLLADVLKVQRVKLYVDFERVLSTPEKDQYREKLVERSKFRPTAYILGKKSFFDSDFYVDENVLIPRPETEELVAWVLEEHPNKEDSIQVLDLCSGSGCIGISLAKARKNWEVSFSDLAESAIAITNRNAKQILGDERKIQTYLSDLFESIPISFDRIVSNPPYIPDKEKPEVMDDVRLYEPHLALFLSNFESFHNRLLTEARSHLNEGGTLYLETHPNWSAWLRDRGIQIGYSKVIVRQDLSGKDRFLKFVK
ncbi:protein-(glutamine-N5) methyltransferase, release factor-specific [Leptospira perolatii]|uniref:Release factor glutamine methyltransferase n=1 Tax=Leptospira perolatii TaxID=2023191 RepID=A0A2M9ZMC5_9LEPT|nr:peptide chain release factor N(5)-glutamine methyltransferase [Leptospira perolatii]PJZ69853.1 protein-(glutamine-N5) methyltransferase, release factor-specific [Leptospira perolatii]PJZ73165.1 protein-(glutamine-N5) methyltransferase, release factor-specific [Leptospira perolatii]